MGCYISHTANVKPDKATASDGVGADKIVVLYWY